MSGSLPREFVELMAIVRGYQRSRAVTVAAELGIADLLSSGPRGVADLAAETSADASLLHRLLRALAAAGVLTEHPDWQFGLSAMGEFLRRDHPLSLDAAARTFGADYQWRAWGALAHSVETGENAAVHVLGTDVWEYRRRHPEHSEVFDAAMRTLSAADNPGVLAVHDFGRYRLVADIGGGMGAVLAAVLAAHPGTQGILFDQAHVVANADAVLRDAGSPTGSPLYRATSSTASRRVRTRTCSCESCTTGRTPTRCGSCATSVPR